MIDVLRIFAEACGLAIILIFSIVFMGRNLVWSLKEVVDYYLSKKREMLLELEEGLGSASKKLN